MKKIRLTSVILPLLLMTPPISADDKFYHWQSEDGQSHFSDKKPAQHTPSLKQLRLNPNKLNTMVSTPLPPATIKSYKPSPPANSNAKKKKAAEKAKRSKLCKKHKEQLRALRGRMRNGYSAKQAPKLLQRERTLNDLRRQYCH